MDAREMTKKIVAALDEKKAEDIRIIDIQNVSVMADYFVIANGNSRNQLQALIDNVEENLAKTKEYLAKKYNQNQTENSYWQSVMTSWLQYGADYHTGYLEAVEALNADTVKNCLKSVVDQNNVKTVVMVGTQK